MKIRILVLSLVLQVLLVSCESPVKNAAKEKSDNDSAESRISTIPLRISGSDKAPRFIIRRSRPHAVTYNLVKTPLHTFGFGNRNDNGAIITETKTTTISSSSSTDGSRPSTGKAAHNATTTTKAAAAGAAEENGGHKSKVEEKIQSKSDIIDFNYNDGDRFYQPVPYKSHPSIYEYNTMHAYNPTPERAVQSPKYSEAPKLEFLHAYQFADEQPLLTDPSGQEFVEELEYNNKPRAQAQHQPQPLVEITKSKQYSYTLRKPEPTTTISNNHFQGFHSQPQQQQQQQQQLPQAQSLYQPQQQYQTFGRETSYLKSTPSSVVGAQPQQEEFKFQRVNRIPTPTPVEKEIDFDEDTKPVHIHHHYPIQHIEESADLQSQLSAQQNNHHQLHHLPQPQPQQQQFVHSQLQQSQQSGRNQNAYFPTPSSISSNKGQYSPSNQFHVPDPAEQQQPQTVSIKPYHAYANSHPTTSSSHSYKPKQHHHQHQPRPESQSPVYELPTAKPQPPSKWDSGREREPIDSKPQQQQQQQPFEDEPQQPHRPSHHAIPAAYPPNTNIRIEIPEEEIYKHIQNSVHQIIRDLKDKRTKDTAANRGRPLAHQDHSWTKYIAQDENRKEKSPPRGSFNKTASFDPFHNLAKPTAEKDTFDREVQNNSEKPRDQPFHHQYQHAQQSQQAASQNYHHSQRIHQRHQQEEEKQQNNNFHQQQQQQPQSKIFNQLRIEENYSNVAPPSRVVTDATHYESGYPREVAPATVDITMSHPKKQTPVIDLNALDVGQTWSHDSHFDNEEANQPHNYKSPDHTHVYFTHNNRPATSSVPLNFISREGNSVDVHVHPTAPANFTRDSFASTTQPLYEARVPPRPTTSLYPEDGQGVASVGTAIHVRDPFPMRQATPTPAFFKGNQAVQQQQQQPLEPEVDIMHGMLPVINQFDNGNRVLKVILDPSKMPQELIHDGGSGLYQSQDFPTQQTIQYNMNHQHAVPILQSNQFPLKQQQQQQQIQSQSAGNNNYFNDQQNFISYPKERPSKDHGNKANGGSPKQSQPQHGWTNNVPEGSAQVIQYLPPPPLPASRSLLPYDSYSPIYNEELAQRGLFHQFEAGSTIMRNKRHRGSEEFKKMMRAYPRLAKKLVKTVKILEPATDLKPPPKYNKFNKKSSA